MFDIGFPPRSTSLQLPRRARRGSGIAQRGIQRAVRQTFQSRRTHPNNNQELWVWHELVLGVVHRSRRSGRLKFPPRLRVDFVPRRQTRALAGNGVQGRRDA